MTSAGAIDREFAVVCAFSFNFVVARADTAQATSRNVEQSSLSSCLFEQSKHVKIISDFSINFTNDLNM